MNRVNLLALGAVTVAAFIASSLWYSPLLCGTAFLRYSAFPSAPAPSALKALFELCRTLLLAYVIAVLVQRLGIVEWRPAIALGLWLWLGFPVVLLTGSILWQQVPWQLAAIHAGDWLIKLLLIPLTMALWRKG